MVPFKAKVREYVWTKLNLHRYVEMALMLDGFEVFNLMLQNQLKFRFSEKATKIWSYHLPLTEI